MDKNQRNKLALLISVKDNARYLHMGRSPVEAIILAWGMLSDGLVAIDDGWVSITQKGRDFIDSVVAQEARQ